MAIALSTLSNASSRYSSPILKSAELARAANQKTAFLSHSHDDAEYVKGFVQLLKEGGWSVYVDWQDASMPPTPNRETARRIKERISVASYFIFLATPNSVSSRWCPWEIGFADGVKPLDALFVVPTRDSSGKFYGSEYLQLYRKIEFSSDSHLAAWKPGDQGGEYLRNIY